MKEGEEGLKFQNQTIKERSLSPIEQPAQVDTLPLYASFLAYAQEEGKVVAEPNRERTISSSQRAARRMTELPRRATTMGGRKSFKNGRPQMHTGSIVLGGQYLDIVKEILMKRSEERTEDDIREIIPLIRNIKFFKEQNITGYDELTEISQCLTYEPMQRGKEVFEYGSVGEKFYMMIEGEVSVLIPNAECRDFKRRYELMIEERKWQVYADELSKVLVQQIAIAMVKKSHAESLVIAANQVRSLKQNILGSIGSQTTSGAAVMRQGFNNFHIKLATLQPPNEVSSVHDHERELNMLTPENLEGETLVDFERRRLEDLLQKKQDIESHCFVIKRNPKNIAMFIEYSRLQPGKTFGEQALLKNNEPMLRAATIKCTKDCHFAVMNKESFQNILKNKIQKTKLEQMDVLQNLPFFRVWTKTQLLKIVNFIIEPKNYVRNQVVYREGDSSDTIYIVQNGDFEVSRKYQRLKDYSMNPKNTNMKKKPSDIFRDEDPTDAFLLGKKEATTPATKMDQAQVIIAKQVRNVETFKLVLLGPGQIFGDDDVLFNRPYTSTIVCRSNQGIVIKINGVELLRKMKAHDECWRIFQLYIQDKEATVRVRLNKMDYVFHKEPVTFTYEETEAFRQSKLKLEGSNRSKQYPSLVNRKVLKEVSPQNLTILPKMEDESAYTTNVPLDLSFNKGLKHSQTQETDFNTSNTQVAHSQYQTFQYGDTMPKPPSHGFKLVLTNENSAQKLQSIAETSCNDLTAVSYCDQSQLNLLRSRRSIVPAAPYFPSTLKPYQERALTSLQQYSSMNSFSQKQVCPNIYQNQSRNCSMIPGSQKSITQMYNDNKQYRSVAHTLRPSNRQTGGGGAQSQLVRRISAMASYTRSNPAIGLKQIGLVQNYSNLSGLVSH